MTNLNRSTADILKDAEETLKTAEHGLKDLIEGHPEKRLSGLRNLVVFGRAVTNVLQNLRSTEPAFDKWYGRYKEEMQNDPLLKYFYNLRSEILKKGVLDVSTRTSIQKLELPKDLLKFGPPPPNAISFFVGDNRGGLGWVVQLPDGSEEKYYISMPSDMGSVTLHFPDSPKFHLGKDLKGNSIDTLSRIYIEYLRQLVDSAKHTFQHK